VTDRSAATRGANLLLNGRDGSSLDRLCAELGERAEPVVADLADRDQVSKR